jgi:hypothetical protein
VLLVFYLGKLVIDSVAKFNHRKLRSAIKLPVRTFHRLRLFYLIITPCHGDSPIVY